MQVHELQPIDSRWTCRATVRIYGMGAKYYPTIKDQKASQRFQQKQRQQQPSKKTAASPAPATKPVKKSGA